jgi:putative flippase GtrA
MVPKSIRTVSRGALVGAAATLADLVALVLLVTLGVAPAVASLPALAIGVAVQFIGSKLFTFEARHGSLAEQGALFLLVEAGALVLNAMLFDLGLKLTPVPYPILRLAISSAVYFGFSLPLWSLVFRRRTS